MLLKASGSNENEQSRPTSRTIIVELSIKVQSNRIEVFRWQRVAASACFHTAWPDNEGNTRQTTAALLRYSGKKQQQHKKPASKARWSVRANARGRENSHLT